MAYLLRRVVRFWTRKDHAVNAFFIKVTGLAIGGFLPLALALTPAHADVVYDWSFTGPAASLGGPALTGSGTLTIGTTTSVVNGGAGPVTGYEITGITGTFGGSAIDALLGIGTLGGNDNLLFPTSTSFLDGNGFAFSNAASDDVAIWGFYAPGSTDVTPGNNYAETVEAIGFGGVGVFDLTPVPEPASMALLSAGLFGLGMVRRKRS
jgi:hypothetical protein